MDYNVISKYINYITKKYLELFKIVFRNKYQKSLCLPFIERYIEVRYYNETNYLTEKDFVNRINKELVDLAKKMLTDDNEDDIKNIVAMFGYILYFDDVYVINHEMELIDTMVSDDIIKIDNSDGLKNEIKEWCLELNKARDMFNNVLVTKDFSLIEDRLYRKLYSLDLKQNVKISNLYSEYAIDKAYNTGTVNEDKLFVMYILASQLVLENAVNLDFSRYYMVPFASTLFEKEKKCNRLLSVIDNALAKKFISIRITYTDYKNNKAFIDKLINDGYSFGLELDSTYTGIISELILFPYIFVHEDSSEYEMLNREKFRLKSKIVKI